MDFEFDQSFCLDAPPSLVSMDLGALEVVSLLLLLLLLATGNQTKGHVISFNVTPVTSYVRDRVERILLKTGNC